MDYRNTSVYCELCSTRSAEVVELEAQRNRAARSLAEAELYNAEQVANPPLSKRGRPLKPKLKKLGNLQRALKSSEEELAEARQCLQDVYDLKLRNVVLLHMLMEADGTLWTPEEAAEWSKELANQEGRGEKGLRMRYGLPLVSTTKDVDLPQINEEVKNVESSSGKNLQPIRTGAHSQKMYGMWLMLSAEKGFFKDFSEKQRTAFGTGELLPSFLREGISKEVRDIVYDLLKPSSVIGHYAAVNGTTSKGFIRVPSEDADVAWRLVTITKYGPKYELQTEYLIERLKKTTGPTLQLASDTYTMKKIALIAGSFKPLHAGHASIIQMAARECDEVHLYVSTSDRVKKGEAPILGSDMAMLWKATIAPSLPKNVRVFYSAASPIRDLWQELGEANEAGSQNDYVLYSDPVDLTDNFPEERLQKYCGKLYDTGHVRLRPVERASTIEISGTKMRELLAAGDKENFIKYLPQGVDQDLIWDTLRRSTFKLPHNSKKGGR